MIDTALALVAQYGALIVGICAYLSCLLIPIPTALVMLAAGGFVAAGDLQAALVWASAWGAAVAGDQTGYWIGRGGGAHVLPRLARSPTRAKMLEKARAFVDRHGGLGVFFSTWLFAPLGPWVNFVAGAAGLGWVRFSLWDMAGEAIWVTGYLSLGYLFGDRIEALAELLGNTSGFLVAGLITAVLGALLVRRLRSQPAQGD